MENSKTNRLLAELKKAGIITSDKFCETKAKLIIRDSFCNVFKEAVEKTIIAKNKINFISPNFND